MVFGATARFLLLDPIVELAPQPLTSLVKGEANWSLECWILLEPATASVAAIQTLCASESGASLFSITQNQFGVFEPPDTFTPYGPEGALTEPPSVADMAGDRALWRCITVTALAEREAPEDPASPTTTIMRLYIDGDFCGRLTRPYAFMDIEVVGNSRDGRQPFGWWSGFFAFPVCFTAQEVRLRYQHKQRRGEQIQQRQRRRRLVVPPLTPSR